MIVDVYDDASKEKSLKLATSAATRRREMYKFWFVSISARFAGGVTVRAQSERGGV